MFGKKNHLVDVITFLSKIFHLKKIVSYVNNYPKTATSNTQNILKSENKTYEVSDISDAINQAFDNNQQTENPERNDLTLPQFIKECCNYHFPQEDENHEAFMKTVNKLKGEKIILFISHKTELLNDCNKIYELSNEKLIPR